MHLVDDDVAERADLVGVVDLAAPARARAEHVAGVVEQRHVGGRPADVGDVGRPRPVQGGHLSVVEHAGPGEAQQGGRAEQVVEHSAG